MKIFLIWAKLDYVITLCSGTCLHVYCFFPKSVIEEVCVGLGGNERESVIFKSWSLTMTGE